MKPDGLRVLKYPKLAVIKKNAVNIPTLTSTYTPDFGLLLLFTPFNEEYELYPNP
jgi:hypothetical protein